MANFKESISKAIGNSAIFNKTTDFLANKQKKFKAEKALEDANKKLTALQLEFAETTYKRKPLSAGRTSTVIRAEIDAQIIVVAECQALVDELNAPKPKPADEEYSEKSEDNEVASPEDKTE